MAFYKLRVVFNIFAFVLLVSCAVPGYGAALAIASSSVPRTLELMSSSDSLSLTSTTPEMPKLSDAIAINGLAESFLGRRSHADIETLTKNAAIRTNQEVAAMQQQAFRRIPEMAARDATTNNGTTINPDQNDLAVEVATNDLLNAIIRPSSFESSATLALALERDRIIMELLEQNRRQQLEIQRLIEQLALRGIRPNGVLREVSSLPAQNFPFIRAPTAAELNRDPSAEELAIIAAIRKNIAERNRGRENNLAANDINFLRLQTNPQLVRAFNSEDNSGGGVTDAFGRRISPFKLRDVVTQAPPLSAFEQPHLLRRSQSVKTHAKETESESEETQPESFFPTTTTVQIATEVGEEESTTTVDQL